jgi:hypothetical protein
VGDVLLFSELANALHLNGGLDVLLGGEVVHDQRHAVFVKHLLCAHGAEGLDGQRCGDVVGQRQRDIALDNLSCLGDLLVGMLLQNLLHEGMSHPICPPVPSWRAG